MVKSGRFQKFDYGSAELNRQKYNQVNSSIGSLLKSSPWIDPVCFQTEPPVYNLKNIGLPIRLFSAAQDILADPTVFH